MPRFPVYLELLDQEAVEVIGKSHEDSIAARKLLEREGFSYQGTVDIFDAGPVMECERSNIASIKNARTAAVSSLVSQQSDSEAALCIVSNRQLTDYRLILAKVSRSNGEEVSVLEEDAAALGVSIGAQIQILELR